MALVNDDLMYSLLMVSRCKRYATETLFEAHTSTCDQKEVQSRQTTDWNNHPRSKRSPEQTNYRLKIDIKWMSARLFHHTFWSHRHALYQYKVTTETVPMPSSEHFLNRMHLLVRLSSLFLNPISIHSRHILFSWLNMIRWSQSHLALHWAQHSASQLHLDPFDWHQFEYHTYRPQS